MKYFVKQIDTNRECKQTYLHQDTHINWNTVFCKTLNWVSISGYTLFAHGHKRTHCVSKSTFASLKSGKWSARTGSMV